MPQTCFKESYSLRIYIYIVCFNSIYFGLAEAAGTDDPEVMNDVYWNLD
ncbi:MutR family transcriptional regulator [Capnocytophaga sp. oral taxon 338 str. F0234]|nr:MutR family transcriptional regulator [Capnocytophaga sp. oral taxon 338 str. F0234]